MRLVLGLAVALVVAAGCSALGTRTRVAVGVRAGIPPGVELSVVFEPAGVAPVVSTVAARGR